MNSKLNSPLTNTDLQKIYDLAKQHFLSSHNANYESHLVPVLCYVKAYCGLADLPAPKEINRDPSTQVQADD